MLSTDYIQKGLLFHKPSSPHTFRVVDHLTAALSDALGDYYPVAGRFVTDRHRDELGNVVGCSVSIDCDGQGVEILHALAHGVSIADVIPPDADVPRVVQSLFPLDGAVGIDGHELPLFVVQVTDLADGVSSASPATTRWPTAPPCGISSTRGPRSRAPGLIWPLRKEEKPLAR
jgi:hypothetical protein